MEKIYFDLKIPGEHNIENARAAIAVTHLLDIPRKSITESLERFSGTWRRADHLGETKKGAIVYDDYAHHPDEVITTLKGFKERFNKRKLIAVFQPHLYSRTKTFFNEFVTSLSEADEIIVLPIYAAREASDDSINSEMLVDALLKKNQKVLFMSDFYEIEQHLNKEYGNDDLIITMGAGDVYKIGENITQWQKSL
jgi:UDP-N-acetylmuramate--alanine ligase